MFTWPPILQPVYQEPFQTNLQRGAAVTLNVETNKSGSAGTVSIGHVQTSSRPEMPKSEKSPHSSGASDDNNSADNLKFSEPATLQLVRKGKKCIFFMNVKILGFFDRKESLG